MMCYDYTVIPPSCEFSQVLLSSFSLLNNLIAVTINKRTLATHSATTLCLIGLGLTPPSNFLVGKNIIFESKSLKYCHMTCGISLLFAYNLVSRHIPNGSNYQITTFESNIITLVCIAICSYKWYFLHKGIFLFI